MSQSKTVQIRRRKQKGKKHLARMARQAKKLRSKNAQTTGAGGKKKVSP